MTTLEPTTTIPPPGVDDYKQDPALYEAVKYATDNCKPQIPTAGQESAAQQAGMAQLMKSLNKKTCKYKKQSAAAAVGGCTLAGCGAAAAAESSQSAEGCEQISILSNVVNQCTQQLSCMLNQASASTTTNVRVYQKIYAEFMGDINGNVDISNTSTTNVKTLNLTQSSVQSAIGATISNGLQQAVTQAQSNENEAFSDPTSQTQLQSMLSNIQNVASNSTVNQSVADTTQNMVVDQNIYVKVWKDVNADFKITNENAISMIAENYVYNALDQVLKSETAQVVVQDIAQTSAQKQTGAASALASFMGPFQNIMIAFACIVGLIVIWKLYSMFGGGSKKKQQQQQQLPAKRRKRRAQQQYQQLSQQQQQLRPPRKTKSS